MISDFYEKKSEVYRDDRKSVGERERLVLSLFPARSPLRILDYGCGAGRFVRILRELGHDAIGMDVSVRAVEYVRNSGASAIAGNAETGEGLDQLTGDYDIITALDVLEHTFDPAETVRRLMQHLSATGVFIGSVPNLGSILGRSSLLAGRFPSRSSGLFDSGHIRWFTLHDLASRVGAGKEYTVAAVTGSPLPTASAFGLWRTASFQERLCRWLARRWPSLWGYQLIFKLVPTAP
jgi:2-polyprenyl-6-hydroxyphenyl methylase/3-demethylubiquinone-9 3-methyltransferase